MKQILILLIALNLSLNINAQFSKRQAADLVMNTIVGNKSDSVNVFINQTTLDLDYYVVSSVDSIDVPYDNYWFFFADEDPEYYWGHKCRYIFVNSTNGAYVTYEQYLPPFRYLTFMDDVSIAYPVRNEPINTNHSMDDYIIPMPEADVNNGKYAVLLNGGEVAGNDHTYFWNDLSHNYSALIEHGYPKDNIFVLSCDGESISDNGANPSMDLDGDGKSDIIDKTCTLSNIEDLFENLSKVMTEGDILYFHSISHGFHNEDLSHVNLCMWENEILWDYELAEMLSKINCSQIIVNVWACYSGGIADDIMAINNNVKKTILTCTAETSVLRDVEFNIVTGIDKCSYLVCTAFRGWHPNSFNGIPWERYRKIGNLYNFDSIFVAKDEYNYDSIIYGGNNNGIYEIGEIINYTKEYDSQFNEYGIKINNCGFIEDLLSLRGITGKVTDTQTVYGGYHIEDTLTIECDTLTLAQFSKLHLFDAVLHITDNSLLKMSDSSAIMAESGNCKIIIDGSLNIGYDVVFEAKKSAKLEVIYQNEENIILNNVNFVNCDLTLPQTDFQAVNCIFKGTPLSLEIMTTQRVNNQTAILSNCRFEPNDNNILNAVYVKRYPYFTIDSCTIGSYNDNGVYNNGIYLHGCGKTDVSSVISNNEIFNCIGTGLLLYSTTADILMNKIHDNGYGVKLVHNTNVGDFIGNDDANDVLCTQYIYENTNNELYMTSSCIPENIRYNAITDNNNDAYVYYDAYADVYSSINPVPSREYIDVRYNYWGANFNHSQHLYASDSTISYQFIPPWMPGNYTSTTSSESSNMLAIADSLNENGNYLEAKMAYIAVVDNYPTSVSAETALKTLFTIEENAGNDYISLKNYYMIDETIQSDARLSHLSSSLANKCNEREGNYEEAINWYENVLLDPNTSYNDSIFAAIDLGELYLEMENNNIKSNKVTLKQYVPKSKEQHDLTVNRLIMSLPEDIVDKENVKNEFPSISNMEISNFNVLLTNYTLLSWNVPESIVLEEHLLSWSNGYCVNSFSASIQQNRDMAHRFTQDDIKDYDGWRIKKVGFVPLSENNEHIIKIWEKSNDELTMIYEEPLNNDSLIISSHQKGEWNYIDIKDDIYVDSEKELWVGFASNGTDYYVFPTDYNGDGNESGNWIKLGEDEWTYVMSFIGNLSIQTIIENTEDRNKRLVSNNTLTGYRVYANEELIKEIDNPCITYFLDFQSDTSIQYCVTAVYGENESEPVCLEYVSEEELFVEEASFEIYPNPTDGKVTLCEIDVQFVDVYNMQGQCVGSFNSNVINLENLPSGMYLLVIEDKNGKIDINKLIKR